MTPMLSVGGVAFFCASTSHSHSTTCVQRRRGRSFSSRHTVRPFSWYRQISALVVSSASFPPGPQSQPLRVLSPASFLALPQRGGATVEVGFCNLIGCLLKTGNEGAAAVVAVVAVCIPQCFAAGR